MQGRGYRLSRWRRKGIPDQPTISTKAKAPGVPIRSGQSPSCHPEEVSMRGGLEGKWEEELNLAREHVDRKAEPGALPEGE